MFYSETLLQKSGPLARVWLSANLERKLSKNHILQSNVTDSVEAIITPNQAPMALRLSGQLLLGVVRIYQRKTRYLLDDCNEAMMKIKMAFRSSGNNDMAVNLQIPNREALLLPDRITPYDNFELPPPPDASWLLSQVDDVATNPISRKGRVSNNRDINLQEDFDNSQFLTDNLGMDEDVLGAMDDLELELDFGIDMDGGPSQSIEIGRRAPTPLAPEDDMFSEFDIPVKDGAEDTALDLGGDGVMIADEEGDINMDDNFQFNPDDQSAMPEMAAAPQFGRGRISESPLSDIDEDFAKEVEAEYTMHHQTDLYEPDDEMEHTLVRRPAQRAKKQKILTPDDEIALSSNHIKRQQANRENIIKAASFLPRDPFLLALMDMQKNGGFVSSIMMEGRSSAWAPELRGMLSLDAVRGMNELKRKRDSGIADVDSDQGASKSPRLELGDDTDFGLDGGAMGNQSMAADGTILEIPADDGMIPGDGDHAEREMGSPMPNFDDTTAPLVHPADSGPVSLGTKHAVHILRDLFGADAASSPDKRKQTSVVFQKLLPEKQTTKAEATKMFFECLVLATKDAIKVEQGSGLGDDIRVRGKRGLWGDWAEKEAGGEIAHENEPEPAAVSAPAVAVSA
ncbi:Rec8 like protein-domain-containing protein [Ilyonectria robusta]|uniref:Rec8 like protein-domain-containing protein n=1 Tax=Ilyonectria robusta TaxID=1079257 RepID=UPI001E8D1CB7|nr:Rec8 like protein-domain-containing protein [Ilyonectria robusta]KAH8737251.1 Rec8 like protein-domain-containing protein [Ilyonectria robusta]